MENSISKFIDSIDLRTAIIWTIIISLITDIISRSTTNAVPTMAINGIFLLIVNLCFYFILLKKNIESWRQGTKAQINSFNRKLIVINNSIYYFI